MAGKGWSMAYTYSDRRGPMAVIWRRVWVATTWGLARIPRLALAGVVIWAIADPATSGWPWAAEGTVEHTATCLWTGFLLYLLVACVEMFLFFAWLTERVTRRRRGVR